MITKIRKAEIPQPGNRQKNWLRDFADATAAEFLALAGPGDVYEVTKAPDGARAQKVADQLRQALHRADASTRDVRVMKRGERVFLEMWSGARP